MSKLIASPTVFVIAKSMIDESQLNDWLHFNELGMTEDTPISLLVDETEDQGSHRLVELAGRHCYRSWLHGRDRSDYIQNIIAQNHGSVLEHASLTFTIQGVSRSLTHELVRHRVGVAISQESQRYVDAKDINFVVPPLLLHLSGGFTNPTPASLSRFHSDCDRSLEQYLNLQEGTRSMITAFGTLDTTKKKRVNEASRSLLPNAAETRLTWTANIRLLRHFLEMRGGPHADLEIRRLACVLHDAVTEHAPFFFEDFEQTLGDWGVNNVVRI